MNSDIFWGGGVYCGLVWCGVVCGVEGVIPVEGNRANVATTAELYAAPAAEHSTECCTNKNKNAPEEWCIHAKRIKS